MIKLNLVQQKIIEAALKTSAPAKHSAESAIRHLERSWQLAQTMPEVAGFLAITAEEEATTAVFLTLKSKNYEGADLIQFKNHRHKNALYPFLLAIHKKFKPVFDNHEVRYYFDVNYPEGEQPFRIGLKTHHDDKMEYFANPHPPLDITSIDRSGNKIDFKKELSELATEKGFSSIAKYIDKIANQRNLFLYASSDQIPTLKDPEQFIISKHNSVFVLLALYLLLEPYKIQKLAQDALWAFLEALKMDRARSNSAAQPYNPITTQ